MTITFYTNTFDRRVVDKSGMSPASIGTVTGTLRRETDVRRPVIQFALSDTDINDSRINYAYIAEWGKYYFVTDKRVLREGLCEFTLQEDVLMTFKTDILASDALIERWEQNESPFLTDGQRYLTDRETATILTGSAGIDPFDVSTIRGAQIVVGVVNSIFRVGSMPASSDTWNPIPELGLANLGNTHYAMEKSDYQKFMTKLLSNSWTSFISKNFLGQGSDGIVSARLYPCIIDPVLIAYGDVFMYNSMVGDNTGEIQGYPLRENPDVTFDFGLFSLPAADDFTAFEPYTKATVYLPYIGFETIPAKWLRTGTGVRIIYNVDPVSGTCQAIVKSESGAPETYLITRRGQIAVDIPITKNNALELARNRLMGMTSLAAGIATNNPLAIASATGSILINPVRMSGNAPESDLARRLRSTPYILVEQTVDETPSGYGHYVGYPSGKIHTLGSMADATLGPRLVKVQEVYWTGSGTATQPEMEEIFSLLKAGVLI